MRGNGALQPPEEHELSDILTTVLPGAVMPARSSEREAYPRTQEKVPPPRPVFEGGAIPGIRKTSLHFTGYSPPRNCRRIQGASPILVRVHQGLFQSCFTGFFFFTYQ
jgi:hypothetical protein